MMEINIPEVVAEVRAAFERYEAALCANEVDTMTELFWADPRCLRFGVGENLYGHEAITRFRRERTTGPISRRLVRTIVTTFGRDFATVNIEYRRAGVDRQSQTWVRTDAGWRVVAAHVSLMGTTT